MVSSVVRLKAYIFIVRIYPHGAALGISTRGWGLSHGVIGYLRSNRIRLILQYVNL